MADQPGSTTRYSPDGRWWWDGSEWRPALSPDGLWRWDGERWVPAQASGAAAAPARRGGSGAAITLGVLGGCAAVVALVTLIVLVVLLTMGHQISNVFSNVAVALQSP